MKKLTWSLRDGRIATVTVAIRPVARSAYADGQRIDRDPEWRLEITAEVEGLGVVGRHLRRVGRGEVAAAIGKLGLTAERMAAVEAAIEEVKANSPEWQAQEARRLEGERAIDAMDASYRAIERAMR